MKVRCGVVASVLRDAEPLAIRPQWCARLVGELRVHPHKHWADYPPQEDRGCAWGARHS